MFSPSTFSNRLAAAVCALTLSVLSIATTVAVPAPAQASVNIASQGAVA